MGVVAVACVAVVSAPMLAARGGVHHRGGRPAERHLYLAGVDFTADPVAFEEAATAALSKAFTESGALVFPKGPPTTSDDGTFSPFIGINPPSFGLMGGGALQRLASLEQGPPPQPPMPGVSPPAQSRGLIQAIGEETAQPPVPPPEPPAVVPDPPTPVVVVITPATLEPPVQPPPAPPPRDPPPSAPVVIAQALAAAPPAAIPEPGTWAMLVLGFSAIGAAIRRRRHERPVPEGFC